MWGQMRLRSRILVGYMIPVAIAIAVAAVTFWRVEANSKATAELERYKSIITAASDAEDAIKEAGSDFRGFVLTGQEEFVSSMTLQLAAYDDKVKTLRSLINNADQLKLLDSADTTVKSVLVPWQDSVIALRRSGGNAALSQAVARFQDPTGPKALDQFSRTMDEFRAALEVKWQEVQLAIDSGRRAINLVVILGAGLGALVSLLAALAIASTISRNIEEAVAAVASSATEIAATVDQHESTAKMQATAVEETTATMDELEASSRQSSDQAESSAELARKVTGLADQGSAVVRQTQSGMENLREKVSVVADQIVRLSEQTSQIGGITNLVSEIAGQTNMLALNAAVEAARAGENGRGFAVVAAEIRKLADQSKKSMERIQGLVSETQNATNSTVMATEESTKTVGESMQLARKMSEAFNSIATSAGTAFERSQQIALNVKQQAAAIKQVVTAMNSLNAGAKETAAGIVQTKISVTKLQAAADKLKSMV